MPNCRCLSLSFPLSFPLTLLCCVHTLLPHLAWAVVAAIVAPRPQDERSSRPRFRSRRCQQDDLSCSRFYLFVFIIQQNQLRLHPVTALSPSRFPLPSRCLCWWHGRGSASTQNWLASSFPLVNLPQLACPVSSRLLLVMTAMSTWCLHLWIIVSVCPASLDSQLTTSPCFTPCTIMLISIFSICPVALHWRVYERCTVGCEWEKFEVLTQVRHLLKALQLITLNFRTLSGAAAWWAY